VKWPIARGRISHPVYREFQDLVIATFAQLQDEKINKKYASVIAEHFGSSDVKIFPFARTAFFAVLQCLQLSPGSKIIMPTITIKPILDVALYFKLTPVFVDLNIESGVWDSRQLEEALANNPSVALLTHLFGVVPKMDEIIQKLTKQDVIVIEDFSHSFGASFENKKIGTFGDFGICSTSSTKSFDTYGGAILIINNRKFSDSIDKFQANLGSTNRARLIKKICKNLILNIASNRIIFGVLTFQAILFKNRRQKLVVGKYTGHRNLNQLDQLPKSWFESFTSFQSRVGLREIEVQLTKDEKRRAIAQKYSTNLNLEGPRGTQDGTSTYWQYISIQNNPIKFRDHLNISGIDCATTSLTNLTKLSKYNISLELPSTDSIYFSGVYLPCYHQLSESDQNRIISAIRSYRES